MPVCGIYMCLPYAHVKVHGKFNRQDLKKGNGRLGKRAIEVARLVMNKTTADSESKENLIDRTLKKGNGRLGKRAIEVARLVMNKTTADSESKGKYAGYTRDLHGQ